MRAREPSARIFEALVSPSGEARVDAARAVLAALPAAGPAMLVGASREAADDLMRDLTRARGASFGVDRKTLGSLAALLAATELARRGLAPITRLGMEALAARVIGEATLASSLRYLEPVARTPSFARAVAATVGELRLEHVAPRALAGMGPGAEDLADLALRIANELERGGLVDRSTLFAIAEVAAATAPFEGPIVLCDVPVRDEAEARFVAALARRNAHVFATVPAGDIRTARAFAAMGARIVELDARGDGALARLQRHIFASDEPPRGEGGSAVELFSAPGEGRECIEIARLVQAEARNGAAFDTIAIALRAPMIYGALLESALERAGIPAWFERGTRRPHSSGRALLALLACKAEGYSAKRFAEYLSLAEVPELGANGAPPNSIAEWVAPRDELLGIGEHAGAPDPAPDAPIDNGAATLPTPRRWEEMLVEAAVLGGRDRWARRLAGLGEEIALRIDSARRDDPASKRIGVLEDERRRLDSLTRFALPVIDALAALPEAASWGEWLEAITALAPRVLRRPDAVLEALAELAPMASLGPVGLAEVRAVLTERLATISMPPPKRRYGRVYVGTPESLRGRIFDVVFVPGLAERLFPEKPREDPLLLDSRRALVSARVAEQRLTTPALRTQADRAEEERLLLRIAVGAARRRVVVSYPRVAVGEETRSRVPSFYALDVVRAVTGIVPSFTALQHDAAIRSEARLAWPAPPNEAFAIDEAERDLAVLGRLLRPGERDVSGRAAYLLRLSDTLGRSLRTRWKRWSRQWSVYDGPIGPTPATLAALAPHRLGARAYSISALQQFAACPYRFYLSSIVGLSPREEIAALERLDPMTRGTLLHRVVAELARDREEQGEPITESTLEGATAALDRTIARVAGEMADALAPPIERVWADEVEALRADVLGLVRKRAEESATWEPHRAEWGFGIGTGRGADARSVIEPALLFDKYLLRGQIDSIDRNRESKALRVTDYKTGRDETKPFLVIGGGETLQPVLYALALEAITREEVTDGRLLFCTVKNGFSEHVVALDADARGRGREALEIIDRAIERAFLAPVPREGACARCSFRAVCGPDEEARTSRKDHRKLFDPGPIDDLFELRRSR